MTRSPHNYQICVNSFRYLNPIRRGIPFPAIGGAQVTPGSSPSLFVWGLEGYPDRPQKPTVYPCERRTRDHSRRSHGIVSRGLSGRAGDGGGGSQTERCAGGIDSSPWDPSHAKLHGTRISSSSEEARIRADYTPPLGRRASARILHSSAMPRAVRGRRCSSRS